MSRRDEQLLYRYSSALERGDFEAVAEVLRDAERDPALEALILDLNDAYTAEPSVTSNHKNPKEIPMIAALYQKPIRPRSRIGWQSLPFVAALLVISLLAVMLAMQVHGSNLSNGGNTGQGETPLAFAIQSDAACGDPALPLTLYSRPSSDAAILFQGYGTAALSRGFTVSDTAQGADGNTWYYVRASAGDQAQGWLPAETYTALVKCVQQAAVTVIPETSATPIPTLLSNDAATLPPTIVPPLASDQQLNALLATQQAQSVNAPCKATPYTSAFLVSTPSRRGTVLKTIPANTFVSLSDYSISADPQGNGEIWYFVIAQGTPGWMLASTLNTAACPQLPVLQSAADHQAQTATATQMIREATRSAEMSTFTPTPTPFNLETTALSPTEIPLPNGDTAGVAQHPFYVVTQPAVIALPLVPTTITEQPSDNPDSKCPTPDAHSNVTMYARPALDSYQFSQDYNSAEYRFSLLDSTDVDGQTWYYVEIDTSVSQKQGWITGDDYNILKDCAPENAVQHTIIIPEANSSEPSLIQLITATPIIEAVAINPTPVPSESSFLLDTCHFNLPNTVTLYATPSSDAQVTDIVHVGTAVEVSAPVADWYWVTVRYADGVGSSGFVPANTLPLPGDCTLTPPSGLAANIQALATFTPTPADGVQAVPTIIPTVNPYPTDRYPIYIVQSGDTLLYILSKFGLDASALPDLQTLNFLSKDGPLATGMALVIPPNQADVATTLTTCTLLAKTSLELRTQPLKAASIVYYLPEQSTLLIEGEFQNGDGMWAAVTAQVSGLTLTGGWIQVDKLDAAVTCTQNPVVTATPTPLR